MSAELTSSQRKYLRGLAHGLDPLVHVGKEGLTDGLLRELDRVLEVHELVKIRYQDAPAREERAALSSGIERRLRCAEVGRVGHVAIFYRRQPDPEKRRIALPAAGSPARQG